MPFTNTFPTMAKWFHGMIETVTRCKGLSIASCVVELFVPAMERILLVAFACILALGGSIVGTIAGGIKGQTTGFGLLDGASKGAITGAIAALQLINFHSVDESLSKGALLRSLLNGKVFMEWICPAVSQLYQMHVTVNTLETIYEDASDINDIRGVRGIPQSVVMKLPFQQFNSSKTLKLYNMSCCSICFQDFEDGELIRILPKCDHIFHLECIDKWLVQQGSCPMCRTYCCKVG